MRSTAKGKEWKERRRGKGMEGAPPRKRNIGSNAVDKE
jgi:hypothetical protein